MRTAKNSLGNFALSRLSKRGWRSKGITRKANLTLTEAQIGAGVDPNRILRNSRFTIFYKLTFISGKLHERN